MHVLEYFQQIYVINLPHRRDRRLEMAEQLEKIGLSFDNPAVRLFAAFRPEDPGGFPNIGARGCFMSHLGVLQDARERKFERILIFEDDLNFYPDFTTRIDQRFDVARARATLRFAAERRKDLRDAIRAALALGTDLALPDRVANTDDHGQPRKVGTPTKVIRGA